MESCSSSEGRGQALHLRSPGPQPGSASPQAGTDPGLTPTTLCHLPQLTAKHPPVICSSAQRIRSKKAQDTGTSRCRFLVPPGLGLG